MVQTNDQSLDRARRLDMVVKTVCRLPHPQADPTEGCQWPSTIRTSPARRGFRRPRCPGRSPCRSVVSDGHPATAVQRRGRRARLPAQPGGPRADHRAHRQHRRASSPTWPTRSSPAWSRACRPARARPTTRSSSPTPTRRAAAEAAPGPGAGQAGRRHRAVLPPHERGGPARRARRHPLVLVNRRIGGRPRRSPSTTPTGCARRSTHLAALGHRRSPTSAAPRLVVQQGAGARPALGTRQRPGSSWSIGHFPPQFEGGVAAADLVLAAGVTAVIAYNDLVALGLHQPARRPRRHRAATISVVGFDDIPMSGLVQPVAHDDRSTQGADRPRRASTCCSHCCSSPRT